MALRRPPAYGRLHRLPGPEQLALRARAGPVGTAWDRLRQNALLDGRPGLTVARAASWLGHCVARRAALVRLGAEGPRLLLPPRLYGYGSTSLYMKRDEYEREFRFFTSLANEGDVVVDVGANFGAYALAFAVRVGESGRVYAFEPGAHARARLRDNASLNPVPGLRVVPLALSDAPGRSPLFHTGGAPTTFSLGGSDGTRSEQVELVTLDSWWPPGSRRLDLMKVDVEGHEPAVLRGARKTLECFRPLLLFEASRAALERNGYRPDASFRLLTALGYDVVRFDGRRLRAVDAPGEGNFLGVHPESAWPQRLRHHA